MRFALRRHVNRGRNPNKRSDIWDENSNFSSVSMESLVELASNFSGKHVPENSVFVAILDGLETNNAFKVIDKSDSNLRKRKLSQECTSVFSVKQVQPVDKFDTSDTTTRFSTNSLMQLDSSVSKFIHAIISYYQNTSFVVLKFLRKFLNIFLGAYVGRNQFHVSVFWLIESVNHLLVMCPEACMCFTEFSSPQRLCRLYYGLHNHIRELRQKSNDPSGMVSRLSQIDKIAYEENFRIHAQRVKNCIGDENVLKYYLRVLEELAFTCSTHERDDGLLRRRVEKINEANSFLPSDEYGNALRFQLYSLFELQFLNDPFDDDKDEIVQLGRDLKDISDCLFDSKDLRKKCDVDLANVELTNVVQSTTFGLNKTPITADEYLGSSSRVPSSDYVEAFLELVKAEIPSTSLKSFLHHLIRLKSVVSSTQSSIPNKIESFDKVCTYLALAISNSRPSFVIASSTIDEGADSASDRNECVATVNSTRGINSSNITGIEELALTESSKDVCIAFPYVDEQLNREVAITHSLIPIEDGSRNDVLEVNDRALILPSHSDCVDNGDFSCPISLQKVDDDDDSANIVGLPTVAEVTTSSGSVDPINYDSIVSLDIHSRKTSSPFTLDEAVNVYMVDNINGNTHSLADIAKEHHLNYGELIEHYKRVTSFESDSRGIMTAEWSKRLKAAHEFLQLQRRTYVHENVPKLVEVAKRFELPLKVLRRYDVEAQASAVAVCKSIPTTTTHRPVNTCTAVDALLRSEVLEGSLDSEIGSVSTNALSKAIPHNDIANTNNGNDDAPIIVTVCDFNNRSLLFKLKRHFKLSKLFKAYAMQSNHDHTLLQFVKDMKVLDANDTVESANLSSGNLISVTKINDLKKISCNV